MDQIAPSETTPVTPPEGLRLIRRWNHAYPADSDESSTDPADQLPPVEALGTDMTDTSTGQLLVTLLRPFFWLTLFVVLIDTGLWYVTPVVVFFLFVSIVTVTHDLVHRALPIGYAINEVLIFLYGALLLESGHAYRITHLNHHRTFPEQEDPEGDPARMSFWQSLVHGVIFLPRLWVWAFQQTSDRPGQRCWLLGEAAWTLGVIGAAIGLGAEYPGLPIYVVQVIVGSWIYPLSTVHLPHDVEGDSRLTRTKTLRGTIIPALFLELTYHLEHHLYPSVPSHHLQELSERLEPYFEAHGIEPVDTW